MKTFCIKIKGLVQGVGFRPFVYSLAVKHNLNGTINNDSSGVAIYLNSNKKELESFIGDLKCNKPEISTIDTIEIKEVQHKEFIGFSIIQTKNMKEQTTTMPLDLGICQECKNELDDSKNFRYKYPFISCTKCGPRYTVINALPFDRVNTSMQPFQMCKNCKSEYDDPSNRRFHTQTIACDKCGPKLSLHSSNKDQILNLSQEQTLQKTIKLIQQGSIIAIKGIGGYHLVCDATNEASIKLLRKRKKREHKPFAVMVPNLKKAKEIAYINRDEEKLLSSSATPIVLVKSKNKLSETITYGVDKIGLFLPYTPLYYLLLKQLNTPIIVTSANISGNPLCKTFNDLKHINSFGSDIWDYCLDNDRDIVNSCDDSVVSVVQGKTIIQRAARGYAPVTLNRSLNIKQNSLSFGADEKCTITISKDSKLIVSPYIGGLSSIQNINYYKNYIESFEKLYNHKSDHLICDTHPAYESAKIAFEQQQKCKTINLTKTQHHYNHIRSVLVEKNITKKVLGVAFDGTGYGDDGKLWGGEFFVCDLYSYERVAHINYFKLLGANKAIKEPRRVALSLLFDSYGKDAFNLDSPVIDAFSKNELNILYSSWNNNLNAPQTSSVGRLFDAVASFCNIVQKTTYEGQSGMLLESFYDESIKEVFPFEYKKNIINIIPMVKAIMDETNKITIVSKFFNTIVKIIEQIYKKYDLIVVVSGGVFQNSILLKLLINTIPNIEFSQKVPCNDSAISLGQIAQSIKEN